MSMKTINLLLIILFLSYRAYAVKITQIKDSKILIDLEDSTASLDQKLYLLNSENKKIAVANILQIKNGKAIAVIIKGKADEAKSIKLIEPGPATPPSETNSPTPIELFRLNASKFAVLLNASSSTMNTKQSDGTLPISNQEDVSLTGSSVGLSLSLDHPLNDWLIFRGTLGYEPFVVSGTSRFLSCANLSSTNCEASIDYLSAGAYVRINIYKSRVTFWGAGGGTTKYPITKSSTALRIDDIKTTFTFSGALGIDYFINNKYYIPVSGEYQLFQSSDTVSGTTILMLRAGFGWTF